MKTLNRTKKLNFDDQLKQEAITKRYKECVQ